MNEVEWLKSLDRTGAEDGPRVDVTGAVMRTVRTMTPDDGGMVLSVAAAVAVAAGVAAVLLAVPSWPADRGPLADLADAFRLVLQ